MVQALPVSSSEEAVTAAEKIGYPVVLKTDEPGIAHAVPDLIAKTLSGQRPLQIFGSGEQTRTLTHVDDIADGIVTAMSSPELEPSYRRGEHHVGTRGQAAGLPAGAGYR